MSRARLLSCAVAAVAATLFVDGPSANSAVGRVEHVELAVAGTGTSSDSATYFIVASRNQEAATVHIAACNPSCRDYEATVAGDAIFLDQYGVAHLRTTVTELGEVDLRFGPGEGNGLRYECVGVHGFFAMQGAVVAEAAMRGTIGSVAITNASCGAFAEDALIEWARGF